MTFIKNVFYFLNWKLSIRHQFSKLRREKNVFFCNSELNEKGDQKIKTKEA